MLVLSREMGESIVLPEYRTRLTILRVGGQRVRIGIDAPPEVGVHREETWQRICQRNREVAQLPACVNGRLEVLWLDDGRSPPEDVVADSTVDYRVRFNVVQTIGACVESLTKSRTDLLVLDVDAVQKQPNSVLQFLRRDKDLALIPVILVGESMASTAPYIGGVTILDRLNKPISRQQLARGVQALFSYSVWREALGREEWHGDDDEPSTDGMPNAGVALRSLEPASVEAVDNSLFG